MLTIVAAMESELAGVRKGLKNRGPVPVALDAIGVGRQVARASVSRLLDSQLASGDTGLLLIGYAGGLDPALKPGDLLMPTCYYHESGDLMLADGEMWQQARVAASEAGLSVAQGNSLTVRRVVTTPEEKQLLYSQHQISTVNLEDYWVAELAARFRVPFLAVRAVLDPAYQALPGYVLSLAEGPVKAILNTALRPWRVPTLLKLAGMRKVAQNSLTRFALGFISYRVAAARGQPPGMT